MVTAGETTSGRGYRSERRAQQARETRERILVAAVAEFERRGYAAAPMRAIAEAAGVSVATVELGFGTKAELLRCAIRFAIRGDGEPTAMLQRSWTDEAARAASVDEFLAVIARVLVVAEQRAAGVILAAFEAAQHDRTLCALAGDLRERRAETASWIVDGLSTRAPLRPELSRERAIDTIWLMMDPHGFISLTKHRGWSSEQFEAWFADTACRLLVADGAAPLARPQPAAATTPPPRRRTP